MLNFESKLVRFLKSTKNSMGRYLLNEIGVGTLFIILSFLLECFLCIFKLYYIETKELVLTDGLWAGNKSMSGKVGREKVRLVKRCRL